MEASVAEAGTTIVGVGRRRSGCVRATGRVKTPFASALVRVTRGADGEPNAGGNTTS